MKIYCASDMHIGFEDANYPKINEFFELVKAKADQLILCGDILDLWLCPIEIIERDEPYKSTYEALLSTIHEVPTKIIWGNHDYLLQEKTKIQNIISDDFVLDRIYFCHGWRFDLEQRLGAFLYSWLINKFPYLYQKYFKHPFEIKKKEQETYKGLNAMIYQAARNFIKKENIDYLVMGHTHYPLEDDKLLDCGDMIDSLSYIIIDNGKPELKKMPRD